VEVAAAVQRRLKGVGVGGKLPRGEVAEWLNATVSKTVTSVIPASGVRIPPSPLIGSVLDLPSILRPLYPSRALARLFDPRRVGQQRPCHRPDLGAPVE
jgi:hypothetical protein